MVVSNLHPQTSPPASPLRNLSHSAPLSVHFAFPQQAPLPLQQPSLQWLVVSSVVDSHRQLALQADTQSLLQPRAGSATATISRRKLTHPTPRTSTTRQSHHARIATSIPIQPRPLPLVATAARLRHRPQLRLTYLSRKSPSPPMLHPLLRARPSRITSFNQPRVCSRLEVQTKQVTACSVVPCSLSLLRHLNPARVRPSQMEACSAAAFMVVRQYHRHQPSRLHQSSKDYLFSKVGRAVNVAIRTSLTLTTRT